MKVVEVTLAAEQADHLVGSQEVLVQSSSARGKKSLHYGRNKTFKNIKTSLIINGMQTIG